MMTMMIDTLMDMLAPDLFPEQTTPEEGPFDDLFSPDDGTESSEADSDSPFDATEEIDSDENAEATISDEPVDADSAAGDLPITDVSEVFGEPELPDDGPPDTSDGIVDTIIGAEASDGALGKSVFDPVFNFMSNIWDRFFLPFFDPDDIVHAKDFAENGMLDTKNHLVVVGDVASDINYISKQRGPTCSLMAQEQFVHRLVGKPIPEEYLEWQAEKWGVYTPDLGTYFKGQDMILDHFNIPYKRRYNPDLDDIIKSMSKGNDVLIGVDAREFYQDSSIPPGSGHAVALVGRGLDPVTGELQGFYVTDSNYPGRSHYLSTDQLLAAWDGDDMISIPETLSA